MVISMLKIRRPLGRLIFNMGIAIPGKTVFLIETGPWCPLQSSTLQIKAEYTETGPRAYWCPAILSFQTGMDATLHA